MILKTPQQVVDGAPRNITHLQHYAYRLAIRSEFSILHHSCKLFLMYILDAWLTVEGERLKWLQLNQNKLRSDKYNVVKSYVERQQERLNNPNFVPTAEEAEAEHPLGRPVILPSTHQGGIRYMQQSYQDAMSIVGRVGPPDLFLTFTCNSNWQEIQENLKEGQKVEYRVDIEARVFKIKLNQLIRDITENHIFGVPIAYLYVIEFQKRGHPHAHLLITLREQDKIIM